MLNFVAYLLIYVVDNSDANLHTKRDALLQKDANLFSGSTTKLSDKEILVNTCLMNYKLEETQFAFRNPQYYNFSKHYFDYKDDINKSIVYRIIKDIPKGAALHIHDMAILGPDYLMNLTYMDNLYVCFTEVRVKLRFANQIPNDNCNWQLISDARKTAKNLTEFNEKLRNRFTLVKRHPDTAYPSINHVWGAFMTYFFTVESFLTYIPVWEQYFYDALKVFRDENILYVEVRSVLPMLYDLNGKLHNQFFTAETYQEVIKRFVKDYPDFIGAKLIYAPLRQVDNETLQSYLEVAREIKHEMPELLAGFDLVGSEDLGGPLHGFLDELSAFEDIDYFFHAGETNWYGFISDENLADAIVLNSKRIGHALALPKHPYLVKEVVKRDIAIEANVISNNIFTLVQDIRQHPLSTFLSLNVSVVLSSDAPGAWESDVISHDFYVAFIGATSRSSDLRLLKTLALNSLKYSALNEKQKSKAVATFNNQWDNFINNFDCSKYNPGVLTLMCRRNVKGQDYCIQFNKAMQDLNLPVDNTPNNIITYLRYKL